MGREEWDDGKRNGGCRVHTQAPTTYLPMHTGGKYPVGWVPSSGTWPTQGVHRSPMGKDTYNGLYAESGMKGGAPGGYVNKHLPIRGHTTRGRVPWGIHNRSTQL